MKKASIFVFIALAPVYLVKAQSISREVIASAGEYSVSSIGSLSWTVGETITETVENSAINVILTQGFQQPDTNIIDAIAEVNGRMIEIKLYPVPASQVLNVAIKHDGDAVIQLTVLDMLGRIIRTDELRTAGKTQTHQIDVSALAAGMYIVRMAGEDGILGSYKWQKID